MQHKIKKNSSNYVKSTWNNSQQLYFLSVTYLKELSFSEMKVFKKKCNNTIDLIIQYDIKKNNIKLKSVIL